MRKSLVLSIWTLTAILVLDELSRLNIKVTSTTLDIVGFPDVNIEDKMK